MPNDHSEAVSKLLAHWAQGDQKALTALLPLVYNELRRAAHYQLQRERPGRDCRPPDPPDPC
jgi:hypothetical protein